MDSGGLEALTTTPPARLIESADCRSSKGPAESVFDWADKLLARYPPEVDQPTALPSQSSLFDLDSSVVSLGNIGRPGSTSGKAASWPMATQGGGFQRLDEPPNLVATEIASPLFLPAVSYPSSYDWQTSTPAPSTTRVLSEPDFLATALAAPPKAPLMKRTKVYNLPTFIAGDRSSSSALLPPSYVMETSVDPAAQAGGSISVEEAPSGGELEKVQHQHGSTGVRTWFPSFPRLATTEPRRHALVESQRRFGPPLPCVEEDLAGRGAAKSSTTAPKPLATLSRYALDSTGPVVLVTEESFFTPWTNGEAGLLTLDGRHSIPFSATIGGPPNFSYDPKVGSWVTYRRSQISLDVSFGLPPLGLDLSRLCTTANAVPIERFEVEVTSWSNADGNRKVDLHQLDKTRILSRAAPLGRQVLRPGQAVVVNDEGSQVTSSPARPDLLLWTTHFRRVHYARSTPNDPRHHNVRDSSVVLRVSVLAIHRDASESVLGGWTSAPHLVRGRSRVQFGGGGGGGDGTSVFSSSSSKSLQSSASLKTLAAGPVRERARNVKAKKKKRRRDPTRAEFVDESDAEAEAGS